MKNIVVVGNGKTSRANVEALIDDYFYVYPEMTVYIPVYDSLSEGQVWALQYASDKNKTIIAKAKPSSKTFGVPVASLDTERYESPLSEILTKDEDVDVFILWDETDNIAVEALALAKEHGNKAFDLTNGLLELGSEPVDLPEVPEVVESPVKVEAPAAKQEESKDEPNLIGITLVQNNFDFDDDDEDYDDEDDEDEHVSDRVEKDLLMFSLNYIINTVVDRLEDRIRDLFEK